MYTLLLLTCLHAAFLTVGSLSSDVGLGEPHTLEEPPHVMVMDVLPDGTPEQGYLSTRQKNVLLHPKIQEMLRNKLNRDLMAYEEDREESDRAARSLPPGFVPPRILAEWGINWAELARDDEYDSENDTETSLEALRKENKENQSQELGRSLNDNIWSLSYWHPSAMFGDSEHEGDEE